MQRQEWVDLIERIPAQHQEALGLVTSGGVNLSLQSVMRLEEAYMMVRGRLVGSTDAGQLFFIPYDQINCMVLTRPLKDFEVQAWFGGAPAADGAPKPAEGAAGEPAPEEPAAAAQGLSTSLQAGAPLPGKAAILERLRKRTGGSAPGTVKKPEPTASPAPGTPPKPAAPAAPATPAPGTPAPRPPLSRPPLGGQGPAPRPPLGGPGPTPRPPLGGQNNPPPAPPEK